MTDLVLCEGSNDLNFIKGMIEGSRKKVKFTLDKNEIDEDIRSDYYDVIVCAVGGKDQLPRIARYMISRLRSLSGTIRILYVKDKVHGNRVGENLFADIRKYISSEDKFPQQKPSVVYDDVIFVNFKKLNIEYHIVGVDQSLEHQVWRKVLENDEQAQEMDHDRTDDHEKIMNYCSLTGKDSSEFFMDAHIMFDHEDLWYVNLSDELRSFFLL